MLTQRRLDETVPIGNAAMKDRTFIEWDKDDIDALGLMKVDVLALGMLTAIKRAMTMLVEDHGLAIHDMADIPEEDPAVYDMLCKADSVGVFQVESRAQMSMLPRLKPREFYDLVIEVAIVRPGPIQGDMVHPYLRRRDGLEPVTFPAPSPEHGPADELKTILGKTLGVPLFQEQAMKLAMEAAKFTPEEANGLRRSMATFRNLGTVGDYGLKFVEGHGAARLRPGVRPALLQADRGLRLLRLSREPRGELRQAGLRLGLDKMSLPGRFLRRAAEQPADGLLPARPAGPRRPRARRRGPRPGRGAE